MSRGGIHQQAVDAALDLRVSLGLDFRAPVSPYDICEQLGLSVRFVEVPSLEGLYIATGLRKPTVFVSSLRPLGRRAFTCAHELGHHVFGDGSSLDEVGEEVGSKHRSTEERRADSFAGHLLMPKLAVARSFTARGLKAEDADPIQVFTVACEFGVGYTTLVHHLALALDLVSQARMRTLLKVSVARIREEILGRATSEPLLVADMRCRATTLDAEAGNLILLPGNAVADTTGLDPVADGPDGRLYKATRQGIHRVSVPNADWAVLLRVSRANYDGLARYRHLEEDSLGQ